MTGSFCPSVIRLFINACIDPLSWIEIGFVPMAVILGHLLDLIQGNRENGAEFGGGHTIENLFITA